MREDKRGTIDADLPAILDRLQIEPKQWHYLTIRFESRFKNLVGTVYAIKRACQALDRRWVHGIGSSRTLFDSG